MLFFLAILPLVVVSVLLVVVMAIADVQPAFMPRVPRVKAPRAKAAVPLNSAALRGLY